MAYSLSLPPGLLSFLYNAVYNQQIINELRNNQLDQVIAAFELNSSEESAVRNALQGGEPSAKELEKITDLLKPYLQKGYGDIW